MRRSGRRIVVGLLAGTLMLCGALPAVAAECTLTLEGPDFAGVKRGESIGFHAVWISDAQTINTSQRFHIRREPSTPWYSDTKVVSASEVGVGTNIEFDRKYFVTPDWVEGGTLCFVLVRKGPDNVEQVCGAKVCTKVSSKSELTQSKSATPTTGVRLGKASIGTSYLVVPKSDLKVRMAPFTGGPPSLRVTNGGTAASGLAVLKVRTLSPTIGERNETFDVPVLNPNGDYRDYDIQELLYDGGSLKGCVYPKGPVQVPEQTYDNNCYYSP